MSGGRLGVRGVFSKNMPPPLVLCRVVPGSLAICPDGNETRN